MSLLKTLVLGGVMTQMVMACDLKNTLISHHSDYQISLNVERERLQAHPSLTLPLDQELELLQQVTQFDLGRFLMANKGLNGEWTAYIISKAPTLDLSHPLEKWVIHQAPAVRATRERFGIFQKEIQSRLRSGMTLASLPCGLMDDLLTLNYTGLDQITLVGIDLDPDSIRRAEKNTIVIDPPAKVKFLNENAWNLEIQEEYDLLTSNGLNIYEPDEARVIELYKKIYQSLRPGGTFVTSFLTPPPTIDPKSPWKNYNLADVLKQKALFSDVLQVKWQSFRSEEETRVHLEKAGFTTLEVIYDSQGMFPTVIAEKNKTVV